MMYNYINLQCASVHTSRNHAEEPRSFLVAPAPHTCRHSQSAT